MSLHKASMRGTPVILSIQVWQARLWISNF